MLEFIKMFGLGILYTILFPFILVFFALCLVYVILNYFVMEIINFFGFFFGHTFTTDTELDKKLKEIKAESHKQVAIEGASETIVHQGEVGEAVSFEQKGSDEQ